MRLELTLKAIVVPIFGASAYVAVFEWSPTGGMVHIHYVLWKPGAPRFDLRAQRLQDHANALRKAGLLASAYAKCKINDVVDFFADYITEWNLNKDTEGNSKADCTAEDVNQTYKHTASLSVDEMLHLLEQDMSKDRHEYYKRAVRTEQMHDFHHPDPLGPPNPCQACARLMKGTVNMYYCSNGYPRDTVREPCDRNVAQDAMRADLWRCNLCRNDPLMNGHMPAVTIGGQSNSDGQPVCTKHQSEMYCCKYVTKHSKKMGSHAVLHDVLDDMERKDASAKEKFGNAFEESKLGSKLHKTFMAEIGEEMCQAEVAHYANKCPEYFCSRPEKAVHLYKKALAINTSNNKTKNVDTEDGGCDDVEDDEVGVEASAKSTKKQLATKPSDLELYERRTQFTFQTRDLSDYLPRKDTPEDQVAAASVYEFFRLVRYHGGKHPTLSWYPPFEMPIVTMSPAVKLREGADFTFGARWALMQYHPWNDRHYFLNMDEAEVKTKFRAWIDEADCPWYVRDDYLLHNNRRIRGVGQKSHRGQPKLERMTRQAYEEKKKLLIEAQDYEGARDLKAAYENQIRSDSDVDNADNEVGEEEEESTENEANPEAEADTRILKLLYKGNMEEANRSEVQARKAKCFNHKHNYYRNTRCANVAQEEQSALPGGVINVNEDSSDIDEYSGEQKEIQKEIQELRGAQQWINQKGWDATAEGRAVSSKTGNVIDLGKPRSPNTKKTTNWDEVHRELQKGNEAELCTARDRFKDEKDVLATLTDYDLDDLDPTQRVFAERVLNWAREVVKAYKEVDGTGKRGKIPILRSWLGGSAGSGKSTALKTCVQHIRALFYREDVNATVELTAYTGVAAFNIGFGARTACSSFNIAPNATWKSELVGDACRKLEEQWQNVELLIVDEVSFIGRAFFARMHFRLQQARRGIFTDGSDELGLHTFGSMSIILVGDFGQLEPIEDWSLCDPDTPDWYSCPKSLKHLRKHGHMGKVLVDSFMYQTKYGSEQNILEPEAIMLHRIHRSGDDMEWTKSCLRLRDFECTKDDWKWWHTHDLDRGHLTQEQKDYFDNEAVWLCARCEDVGERNGRKLAHMAEDNKLLIHKINAQHSKHRNVQRESSKAFEGLRSVVHLVRGCKVMLTRNIAYRYGLANGTRGKLVGVVYGAEGVGSFPEAIVVDVPDYCGPAFYPDEPTWVPILPKVSVKTTTRASRQQFPIVAGFAITVNKAQGLTIKEGVVIHLVGGQKFRPAAKHGLPFVAWTRSTSFALTAFKNLPAWNDFERGADSDMLRLRREFTKKLDILHRETMAKHSPYKTKEQEDAAWEQWKAKRDERRKRRKQADPPMHCPACAAATAAAATAA